MAPRVKSSELTTPPPSSVPPPMQAVGTNSHDFTTQIVFETQKSIGALEATIRVLTANSDKHETKIDKVLEEMYTAKGSLNAIKKVAGIMGAVGLVLLSSILGVLLKHFHWI